MTVGQLVGGPPRVADAVTCACGSRTSWPRFRPEATSVNSSPTTPGVNGVVTGVPSDPGTQTTLRPPSLRTAVDAQHAVLGVDRDGGLRRLPVAQLRVATAEHDRAPCRPSFQSGRLLVP